MKIYTATFLNNNYGSVLQAFALQSCLRSLGAEPCVLLKKNVKKQSLLYRKLSEILHLFTHKENYSFKKRLILFLDNNKYHKKNVKIERFIRNHLTTYIISDKNYFCQKVLLRDDIFLAGSDQVWNKCNPLSPWYTFRWVKSNNRKYSYAASIGKSGMTRNQIVSYVDGLSDFTFISLREQQAVNELSNFFRHRIRQDVDPTLLYEGAYWKKIASPRIINEPYVFVYRLRPNDDVFQLARRVACEKKYKIFYTGLCASHAKDIHTIYDAGIEDFLSLILYADVVITNSFHGTVFSVLFEKPFLSVDIATTGSRVDSFLDMLNLKTQLIKDVDKDYSLIIDYKKVNEILLNKRRKSLEYILKIINQ